MKLLAAFFAMLICIGNTTTSKNIKADIVFVKDTLPATTVIDTTPRVTGIGGIFFFCDSPGKLKQWYSKNLGLATNDYGSTFEFRNANDPQQINYLEWSPFKNGSSYFGPSKKDFMINYRVQNLEGLLRNLKANGVTILDTVEHYDYGNFVHIMDKEGNKIELWEPVDSILTRLGTKTTK